MQEQQKTQEQTKKQVTNKKNGDSKSTLESSSKKPSKKSFDRKKQKPKKKLTPSKARGSRCFNRCKELWPDLFDLKKIKPYSMMIRNELIEDAKERGIEISPSVIYTALHWAVNTYVYQKAIGAGGHRYDMHGNKTTEITEEHQKFAKDNAKKIKELLKPNRKKTTRPTGKRHPNKNNSFKPRTNSNGTFHKRKPEQPQTIINTK